MSKDIYLKTNMKNLPKTCGECSVFNCRLPAKKNSFEYIIKKEYYSKRHENCPLKEIEIIGG